MEDDLWGDLPKARIPTPKSILDEQANALTRKSGGVIEGRIVTLTGLPPAQFGFDFNIVTPQLGYSFTLLRVTHSVMLFPVNIVDQSGGAGFQAGDAEVFKERLRSIFRSEPIQRVLTGLLSSMEVPKA